MELLPVVKKNNRSFASKRPFRLLVKFEQLAAA